MGYEYSELESLIKTFIDKILHTAGGLTFMVVVIMMIAIITLGIGILFYVFNGIGLSKATEKAGKKHSWLAWIPFANSYLVGNVAFSKPLFAWLGVVSLIFVYNANIFINGKIYSVGLIPGPFGSIVQLAGFIYLVVCYHKIYTKYSKEATVMTVFTVLTGLAIAPIFLFAIRKNPLLDGLNQNGSTNNNQINSI